ncbi:MAG TPA: aquaporin [Candidatus Microsaccharimonas sp.]|jgi:aquaporin Z
MATKKAATTKKTTTAKKSAAAKTTKTTVTTAPVAATTNTFAGHIQQSVRSVSLWRALAAELVGTFLFAGVVIAGQGQPIFVLFALVGIVLSIGAISGAYVNPALTIGALVTRRIGWLRAIGYIIAQCLGAALAYIVLNGFLSGADAVGAQAAAYGQTAPALFAAADVAKLTGKEWFIFFSELAGTAILGFAIANATRVLQDRVAAALTAGTGIFIALMVAVSAASYVGGTAIINPAVAIALHAYSWANIWPFAIYALAPAIGGVLGFVIYDLLRGKTALVTK